MNTATIIDAPSTTVTSRKGGTLTDANRQWASRPADETFHTLEAFRDAMHAHKRASFQGAAEVGDLSARAIDGEVCLVGKAGVPVPMTHWAFGQVSRTGAAPAAYLRSLPAELAAECLTTSLRSAAHDADGDERHARLLLRKEVDAVRLHAVTSGKYARVWNAEIADAVLGFRDANPTWQNPEAFRTSAGKAAHAWGDQRILPCAFGGDRDCFVFLVDYEKTVKVPGQDHPLARGFFLENSEVGAGSIKLTMFLFDFVCANMLVWGSMDVTEVRMRHIGDVRDRFLPAASKPMRALSAFAQSSAREDEARIVRAMDTRIADTLDDARKVIAAKQIPALTQAAVSAAYEIAASTPRYGDPLSVWGIANGLTEYSQRGAVNANERIAIDRAAGKLFTVKF